MSDPAVIADLHRLAIVLMAPSFGLGLLCGVVLSICLAGPVSAVLDRVSARIARRFHKRFGYRCVECAGFGFVRPEDERRGV